MQFLKIKNPFGEIIFIPINEIRVISIYDYVQIKTKDNEDYDAIEAEMINESELSQLIGSYQKPPVTPPRDIDDLEF